MLQGLENRMKVAYFEYDFAKDGGAVGDITLRGANIEKGAVVVGGMIDVETAVTSGGAATVALKLATAADVLAATGKASFSLNATLDVVPVRTAATAVKLTANKDLTMTVAVAALTAGKFTVALYYVVTR
jgi:hypothetical protein